MPKPLSIKFKCTDALRQSSWSILPRAWALLVSLLTATLFVSSQASAARLWPKTIKRFFSEDLSPVSVTLVGYDSRLVSYPTFVVPRAWIVFADGCSPLKIDHLPETILTKSIQLSFVNPSGEALSVRAGQLAAERRVSLSAALNQLRPETYAIALIPINPAMTTSEWRDHFAWGGSLRGLTEANKTELDDLTLDNRSGVYFSKPGHQFAAIHCVGKEHARYYCDDYVRLNHTLGAIITFLDFRYNGGVAYADERVRSAREILCHQDAAFCPHPLTDDHN